MINKIVNKYLILNFLKVVGNVSLFFICASITLNLFEEIEFFKNLNVGLNLPFLLTSLFVPNLLLVLIPFIIFLSSIWFFISIGLNRDLLTMKIFGYSNFKIIMILGTAAFILGVVILVFISPMTSSMIKSYEDIKAKYSRDVDHLFAINKNGLWIKEKLSDGLRIITAVELKENSISDVSIFDLSKTGQVIRRIEATSGDIKTSQWTLNDVEIYEIKEGKTVQTFDEFKINSLYSAKDLKTIYKNLDTLSFFELFVEYESLVNKGYPADYLNKKLNSLLSLPVFLFLMVLLAAILVIKTSIKVRNFYYIFISMITCVIIYYLKDLSLAMGVAGKISLSLSVWMPLILIGIFCTIGIMQINEK